MIPEFKINTGTPLFYGGLVLPLGSVSGTFRRAVRTISENGLVIAREIIPDKIPYYITDFMPVKKVAKYSKREYYVFNINYWDFDRKKWINTDTDRSQRFWALEAFLWERFNCLHIINKEVKDTTALTWDRANTRSACGEKKCPQPQFKGAYGYMCKSPDYTMTSGDVVPDQYVQNRNKDWKKRGVK